MANTLARDLHTPSTSGPAITVLGNNGVEGKGYEIAVQLSDLKTPGKRWIATDHWNALQVDDNSVITNGGLSASGKALICFDVPAGTTDYGTEE